MATALDGKCYDCGSAQQNPASPTCYNCGSAQQYTDDEEEDREKVMDQGLEGEPKTLAGGAMDASRLIAEFPGGWIIAELPGGCQAQPAAKRPRLEVEQMARQMVEEEFAKESSSLVEPVERLLLRVCEFALEKCQKIVEVEKIVEVDKIVEKIVEVEKIVYIEVEKIVEVEKALVKFVEKIVEVEKKTVEAEKTIVEVASLCNETMIDDPYNVEDSQERFAKLLMDMRELSENGPKTTR
jgi:hypothetical protein